ncbi:MAG TPA: RteC domain-containing protein [Cyclobacteriaceae bacterium]|nr:RteC domain-containing protein [Cyclobacteriaceae bacterium]
MNIIDFSNGLEAKMKVELDNLRTAREGIAGIGKVLTFMRALIGELKAFTRTYKFQNEVEEIQFFKEVKPVFVSQYYYYSKVFEIRLFDSFSDSKSKLTNYCHILQQLELYAKKNRRFYEYSLSGNTCLDHQYFTRNQNSRISLEVDETFTTGYDSRLSRILANELIREYILELLKGVNENHPPKGQLTWTSQKIDLTELIYALHSAEVFNNGSATIKVIASAIEDFFNVSLGDYYRTFQEIRVRKKTQTPFLDRLKEKFIHRVNESN